MKEQNTVHQRPGVGMPNRGPSFAQGYPPQMSRVSWEFDRLDIDGECAAK